QHISLAESGNNQPVNSPAVAHSNTSGTPPASPDHSSDGTPAGSLQPGVGLVVCIDPGHPSEVGRGASGRVTTELHMNWVVALKLRDILKDQGYTVYLTKRSENQFVRNHDRAE